MRTVRKVGLVTGASSGLGLEFSRLLAERGFDLVITARRRDRLERLRQELILRYGVNVRAIQNDLDDPQGAKHLYDQVHEHNSSVSLLVNNAGFGSYGSIVNQDLKTIQATIQVNVTALVTLSRLFAADMEARGHGYILNVSSFAALQPIPAYAVYSGAKAFVVAFSLALRHELHRHGVMVSVLVPGFTNTEFHAVAGHRKTKMMRLTSLDASHVARAGLAGLFRGKTVIVPGFWYKVNSLFIRLLPSRVACLMSANMVTSRRK